MSGESYAIAKQGMHEPLAEPGNEAASTGAFVWSGFCCCYQFCDFQGYLCGCNHEGECCCIKNECCLAVNGHAKACGCVGKDSDPNAICGIGLYCCEYYCKSPTVCISNYTKCMCFGSVCQFPWTTSDDSYLTTCVCASCGLMCAPECGCCKKPPGFERVQIKTLYIARGDEYVVATDRVGNDHV